VEDGRVVSQAAWVAPATEDTGWESDPTPCDLEFR
jgi:hypothetical protein